VFTCVCVCVLKLSCCPGSRQLGFKHLKLAHWQGPALLSAKVKALRLHLCVTPYLQRVPCLVRCPQLELVPPLPSSVPAGMMTGVVQHARKCQWRLPTTVGVPCSASRSATTAMLGPGRLCPAMAQACLAELPSVLQRHHCTAQQCWAMPQQCRTRPLSTGHSCRSDATWHVHSNAAPTHPTLHWWHIKPVLVIARSSEH